MSRVVHYAKRFDERLQDWRRGIATTEFATQYSPDNPEFRGYAPTAYRDWRIMRRHLPCHGVFLDYGAGLGRSTILAAELPYERVIGIELDADLVERANQNIARNQLTSRAEVRCVDATSFEPPANTSVAYFCNPFSGSILTRVLDRLRACRPLLVCNLPELGAFEAQIREVPWLRIEKELPLYDGRKCLILAV